MEELTEGASAGIACLEGLTPKQRKFAELYAIHDNGTKAARLAGYGETVSSRAGPLLVHHPKIAQAIEYYRDHFASTCEYSPEKVVKQWAEMASVDVSAFVTDDWELRPKGQLTQAQRAALTGLEIIEKKEGRTVKTKFAKVEALIQLGKLLGMYAEDIKENKGLELHITLGQQVNIHSEASSENEVNQVGHLRIGKARNDQS